MWAWFLSLASFYAPRRRARSWNPRRRAAIDGGNMDAATAVVHSKNLQQMNKALDKLTDRIEDRQLDSSRAQSVRAAVASAKEAEWNAFLPALSTQVKDF